MKKLFVTALAGAILSTSAFALETSVAPKVTALKTVNPTTGLYVGNSFTE